MRVKTAIKEKRKRRLTELPARFEPGFLRALDHRTSLAQRLHTAYDNIVSDLGGMDGLSHAQLALIERFVFLECQMQHWEALIAAEPKKSTELLSRWIQALNSLNGLAKTIGLKRKLRDARTLDAYVKSRSKDKD